MCFLHTGGIDGLAVFHRDLKTSNICLAQDFSAKLIDFDTAKIVESESEQEKKETTLLDTMLRTSRYGVFGTPGYICPEYSRGLIPYEAACDIFSVGIIMVEMIVGCLQANQSTRNGIRFGDYFRRYKQIRSGGEKAEIAKLAEDADPSIDWDERLLSGASSLALACIEPDPSDRISAKMLANKLNGLVQEHSGLQTNDDSLHDAATLSADKGKLACLPQTQDANDSNGQEKEKKNAVSSVCHHCNDGSNIVIQCSNGHTNCRRCLSAHVSGCLQADEGFSMNIFCPVIGCCVSGKPFSENELKRILIPRLFKKWKRSSNKEAKLQEKLQELENKNTNVEEVDVAAKLDSMQKALEAQLKVGMEALSMEVKQQSLNTQTLIDQRSNQTQSMLADQNRSIRRSQVSLARIWSEDIQRCPTIVLLEPVGLDSPTTSKNPMKWARASIKFARSAFKRKYKLYFVCQRTYTAVDEWIEIEVSRKWLVKAAPVLKVSIACLKALGILSGIPLPIPDKLLDLEAAEIFTKSLMNEEVQQIMDTSLEALSKAEDDLAMGAQDSTFKMKQLSAAAYGLIQIEAEKQRQKWERSIVCVTNEEGDFIWAKKQFEHLYY